MPRSTHFGGAWPPVLVAVCPPILVVCCPPIQLVYAWSGKRLPVHLAGACQEGCWLVRRAHCWDIGVLSSMPCRAAQTMCGRMPIRVLAISARLASSRLKLAPCLPGGCRLPGMARAPFGLRYGGTRVQPAGALLSAPTMLVRWSPVLASGGPSWLLACQEGSRGAGLDGGWSMCTPLLQAAKWEGQAGAAPPMCLGPCSHSCCLGSPCRFIAATPCFPKAGCAPVQLGVPPCCHHVELRLQAWQQHHACWYAVHAGASGRGPF